MKQNDSVTHSEGTAAIADFERIDIRVGRVVVVGPCPEGTEITARCAHQSCSLEAPMVYPLWRQRTTRNPVVVARTVSVHSYPSKW
jgi:hypothetical protein